MLQVQVCVNTLCKYLDNILQNPSDEKFRKIKKSNKAYQDRVACIEGTDIFLQAVGFNSQTLDGQDFWVFAETLEDKLDGFQLLMDALVGSEPVRAELDRCLKVLMPNQARKPISLPADFFALSPEEIKREQQVK